MKYKDACKFYGQKGRQLGDRLMYITSNGITEQVHGYKIVRFDGLEPDNIEYVATVPAIDDPMATWDDYYDSLFGSPSWRMS